MFIYFYPNYSCVFVPKNIRKYCSVTIKKRIVIRKYKPIINWINEEFDNIQKVDNYNNYNNNDNTDPFFTIEFGTFLTEKYFKVHVYGLSEKKEIIQLTEGELLFSHQVRCLLEG